MLKEEGVKANAGVEFPVGPGRMGLRLGLIKFIPPLTPPCTLLLLRWLTGVFTLLRAPGGESVMIFSRFPLISRFMMLAGVTGVRWDGLCCRGLMVGGGTLLALEDMDSGFGGAGGAGGGIDRSTGDGESPRPSLMAAGALREPAMLPFRCRVDPERARKSGVDDVEREPER